MNPSEWDVQVLRTPEALAQGVIPLQMSRAWKPSMVVVLPFVGETRITGIGMIAPVVVTALDASLRPLMKFILKPGKTIRMPRDTVHVVEMHPWAVQPKDFLFVRPYM